MDDDVAKLSDVEEDTATSAEKCTCGVVVEVRHPDWLNPRGSPPLNEHVVPPPTALVA